MKIYPLWLYQAMIKAGVPASRISTPMLLRHRKATLWREILQEARQLKKFTADDLDLPYDRNRIAVNCRNMARIGKLRVVSPGKPGKLVRRKPAIYAVISRTDQAER
jgi:hypothetical protein